MTVREKYQRLHELEALVEQMQGRKGVGPLRAELKALRDELARYDAIRAKMRQRMAGTWLVPRSQWQVQRSRQLIDAAAKAKLVRGAWGQIEIAVPDSVLPAELVMASEHVQRHPNFDHLRPYLRAMQALRECPGLPPDESGDDGRVKVVVNYSIYAFGEGGELVLAQRRKMRIVKRYTSLYIDYYVLDRAGCTKVPDNVEAKVKRAASSEPSSMDAPLRALRQHLPEPWRSRIPDMPVVFRARPMRTSRMYKVMRLTTDGRLLSMYNDTEWRLNKRKLQKAVPDHGGGYYVMSDPDMAVRMYKQGVLVDIPPGELVDWTPALVECECGGNMVRYGVKVAVSVCTPVRIVCRNIREEE